MNWQSIINIALENARNYLVAAGLAFLIFYVSVQKRNEESQDSRTCS